MKEKVFFAILAGLCLMVQGCNQSHGGPTVDKTALEKAVTDANALIDATTVGTATGNVPQAGHDAYDLAIETAEDMNDNPSATQDEVDGAVAALAQATTAFKATIIPGSPAEMKFYYGHVFDCQQNPGTNTFTAKNLSVPFDGVAKTRLDEFKNNAGAYIVLGISANGDSISNVALVLHKSDGTNRIIANSGSISCLGSEGFLYKANTVPTGYGYFFSRSAHAYAENFTYSYRVENVTKISELVWE